MLVAPVVLVLVLGGGIRRSPRLLGAAVSWLLFVALAVAGPWVPRPTDPPAPATALRVAVANTLSDNPDPAGAVADVLAQDADVVVVPEATKAVDEALRRAYRHGVRARYRWTAAIGVYSDRPLRTLPMRAGFMTTARAQRVEVDGSFVLWALHLPRPWFTGSDDVSQMRPGGHAETLDAVLDAVDAEDLPVVLAGDLNLTDRGRGYRRVVDGRVDAMRGIVGRPTSVKRLFRLLLLRIDHIVVPDGWCAEGQRRYRITGSDHRGVTARVGPCRPTAR